MGANSRRKKQLLKGSSSFTCPYCRRTLHASWATVDHVVPKSKGGSHDAANTVLACVSCNNTKGTRLRATTRTAS